ncbi:helix-turn-helix domain-containing protein [Flavobacterium galactosidilyticum]|uniref:helix-turn-helix domain-containing protein n=1 Tax=Flavobacterium galactosidilyticum TaxID=2893886 RepID=UPI001E4CAFEE|nr:helix-turn-helix domain-containing protein [Flavobacterium sp. F-340]UFH46904.1 helix-turn-helix domain-containing protein [Flavobacterium sp. F-340]
MNEHIVTQIYNTTPEQLREILRDDTRKEIKELFNKLTPKPPVEFLTRKEVSTMLKVALSTVSEWDKLEILKPYRIGNLVRYKSDEIEEALKAIKK